MTDAPRKWIEDLQFAAATDIGRRRLNNQDSYVVLLADDVATWERRGHLFVVADGMGAHAAGELASKMATDGVAHHYRKSAPQSPPEALLKAFRDTNGEIHQRGMANSEFHNMGTTCSSLAILPQGALVAHVGDSRVYRIRGSSISQMTFDHSLVWEMRAAGPIGVEGTFNIPKNVITRSLGPQPMVQVDLEGPMETQAGDTFVLCSDGLTGRVDDHEIGMLAGNLTPDHAAHFLVDLANMRGGPDNITVLVARVGHGVASTEHRSEPLVVTTELRPSKPMPVAIWMGCIAFLVIAAGLAVVELFLPAGIFVLAGIGLAVLANWQQYAKSDTVPLSGGRRLGKAPYVKVDCQASGDQIERLCEAVREQSRQTAHLDGDERARVDACLEEAASLARNRNAEPALKMLGVAVHLLAHQDLDA